MFLPPINLTNKKIDHLRFSLDCLAKGEPEPKVVWFKDESVLTEADLPNGLALTGEQNQILNFTQPSADLHKGHYHCGASNK